MSKPNKHQILERCRCLLDEQLARIENAMRLAQEEANRETKSSAGDKYETGRSMMQLEKEKYAIQHQRIEQLRETLRFIPTEKHEHAQFGSVVCTDIGWFYLSQGLGEIQIEEKTIRCISMKTPIGIVLEGCEEGDILRFREKEIEVLDVY